MRRIFLALPLVLLAPLTAGCLRTAASVVTFPVKATGKAIDWTTTSQEEADRNYGRKMRKQEAREARERRKEERQARRDMERDKPY
jgi:hypothetical protein